jgi:Sulfotransferase family
MHSHLKKPLLQEEQLYFIHVPKCAGTSFISLIDERYVIDEIIPTHYDVNMLINQITDEQLAGYRFIRGHLHYNLVVPRLRKHPRTITFLREPVVRFISNFSMRQRVSDPLHGLQSTLQSLTLEEFLERKDLMNVFANRATQLIGGTTIDQNGSEVLNLDLAKKRLAEMDFVGIVEHYNDSLALFCYIFDFPPVQGGRVMNVSPDREKRSEISQAILKKVAETEWADIELYKFGRELFENQLARMNQELADNVSFPHPPKMDEIKDDLSLVNPGMGWHVAERHSKYGVIRWSGPETVSHLHYSLNTDRDLILKFDIIQILAMDVLNSLTVRMNGVIIPLVKHQNEEGGVVNYEARISREILLLSGGLTNLTFEVNRTTHPKEVDPQNPDERLLGLCYHVVSLIPA